MTSRLALDFVRGTRASNRIIAATVAISALLLSMLATVLYNFWADAAAQAAANGTGLQDRLAGEMLVGLFYLFVMVLACIALMLIISNAFAVSMGSRVHQIGILATVGATSRQIRSALVRESLAVSLAPAALGVIGGVACGAAFVLGAIGLAERADIVQAAQSAFRYHPLLAVLTFTLVVLTVIASAGMPARAAAKVPPLQAIRATEEEGPSTRRRRDARPPTSLRQPFGFEGELARSSMRARRSALRSTTAALVLSLLVFGSFLSFMTVSKMSVEATYYERFGTAWDFTLDVEGASVGDLEGLADALASCGYEALADEMDGGARIYLRAGDGLGASDLDEALERCGAASVGADVEVVDLAEERAQADLIWNGYATITGGFCGVLALIGIAGVFSQAIGFAYQRKREFARYQSIGMTPGGVRKVLYVEALLTTARPLGLALVPTALVALALTMLSKQSPAGFLATFPWAIALIYVAVIGMLVLVAYEIGRRRIIACDMVALLKDDTLV
ncbi:FtsX-like permease family protein [Adlercreutzia sp. ZJ242]|uniref:ABC transporter permease n=1 Tax=Adlercreutzia sp. ZJ242 TaxID=2709409 RepID=UPI0013EAC9DD|nr:FtsX-like permease family protein [Adlercreutzia sp. ZJ242]